MSEVKVTGFRRADARYAGVIHPFIRPKGSISNQG